MQNKRAIHEMNNNFKIIKNRLINEPTEFNKEISFRNKEANLKQNEIYQIVSENKDLNIQLYSSNLQRQESYRRYLARENTDFKKFRLLNCEILF